MTERYLSALVLVLFGGQALGIEIGLKELSERLSRLERELKLLRLLHPEKRVLVSLRGIAKLNVSVEELDKSIEEAKRSLFRHE